jgi:hypothetical protein
MAPRGLRRGEEGISFLRYEGYPGLEQYLAPTSTPSEKTGGKKKVLDGFNYRPQDDLAHHAFHVALTASGPGTLVPVLGLCERQSRYYVPALVQAPRVRETREGGRLMKR